MFAWWGRTVYRFRYIVIGVMVALCVGGGVYGIGLGEHVTQSGFYDEGSQSVAASIAADEAYGRDRTSHVVAILTPPDGKKVDDPEWMKKTTDELDQLVADQRGQDGGLGGLASRPQQHGSDRPADEDLGHVDDVRQRPAQGRRRRHRS